MSPANFCIPPQEHLHRRLVQRACSGLLAGERVKDTAEALGFTSEFYFSRFFKARTGIAPRDFARVARGDCRLGG
jgi:AraC-like DNA-binding protein